MSIIKKLKILLVIFVITALITGSIASAQPAATEDNGANASAANSEQKKQTAARLNDIQQLLTEKRNQLEELLQQLKATEQESEKQDLQQSIDKLNGELKTLRSSFEQIAIGGIDIEVFDEPDTQKFDWQQELIQISKPFLDSLKDITEKPRKIEKLRSDINQLQEKLDIIKQALSALSEVQQESFSESTQQRLTEVAADWQQRNADTQRALEVALYQLASLQGQNVSWWETISSSFSDFLQGRGLTLLIAIMAAAIVWLVMRSLLWLYQYKFFNAEGRRRSTRVRLAYYAYGLLKVFLMIITMLLVFYFRGDFLMLTLLVVALFFIALGFRQFLPRYIDEARLLLNIGPVRQGERVIYNGLPMEVKSINMYSVLRNPDLEGIIRLPLAALNGLVSRPASKEEPWFPSRTGEFLILNDGTFAQVLRQTLEVVQVKAIGAVKSYASADFLQLNPRNLSRQGYGVAVTFGIDYQHQSIALDQVSGKIQQALQETLERNGLKDDVESILVDFKQAAASSLDYLIYVGMNGRAANAYYRIDRLIQQTCVDICNREGWVIPFNQLTVHQGEGFTALNAAQGGQNNQIMG